MRDIAPLLLLSLLCTTNAAEEQLNPITRVVELMQGLITKIEKDGKAEEDLFDSYVCWYKTVVTTKKASNEEAKNRIESLNAYIDDIQSGRVEFTSERKDLEAEIEKLNTDIESSVALREKEHEDFDAAKQEMETAIGALEEAVDVLGSATAAHSLTSIGFDLRKAVAIGKNFLSETDVHFLTQALDDPSGPGVDWKKLTAPGATFKKTYKSRSLKIQDIMADMLQTFQDNLADAQQKENESKNNHDTLKASKESQLSAAQDALSGGDGEAGARNMNAQQSQDEVDALTTQVSNDQGFVSQVEASYADKVTEWKERKRLRTEEVASISKAVAILTDDDARDLMSSSFKSQQGLFLQEHQRRCDQRRTLAAQALRNIATKKNDMRIAALAMSVSMTGQAGGHFDKIIHSIDRMVSDLQQEYAEDLKNKADCESDRESNTKRAKENAQIIDDETALIARQEALIVEKKKEVESIEAHIKELLLQLEEAQVNRNKERREYKASKADDEAAAVLIGNAQAVLQKFYDDNNLVLSQVAVHQPPQMTGAGEAPPPPPSTFSEPYGGAKGESSGIQSIMAMVIADVEKDIETAKAAERTAASEYQAFVANTNTLLSSLRQEKSDLEGEIGDAEQAIVSAKNKRTRKKSIVDQTLILLKSIAPGCDFIAVNFQARKSAREAEIDGLYEAKAALSGGSFGFLQREEC